METNLSKLYEGCRTFRRFEQRPIEPEFLRMLAETAGKRSSAMNAQVLRFDIVSDPDLVAQMQPMIRWAAKLPVEIGTPVEGEQPVAFIVIMKEKDSSAWSEMDIGIAADTMAVTAWESGIGSCMLGAINRPEIARLLDTPDHLEIRLVIAFGYPSHTSTLTEPGDDGDLSYYVDENRDYYVPKRSADEIIRFL